MLSPVETEFSSPFPRTVFWISVWALLLKAVTPADAAAYAPYVVAVLKKQVLSCSGFLLSRKYVGVGCHCIASLTAPGRPRLTGLKLHDYDFVAGESNPRVLITAKHKRKPRALLTHPFCEREPPVVYDVGVAVMEEPFPTIRDTIEVYDLLSTNSIEFTTTLMKMFSWSKPEDAPKCTFGGWKILSIPEKNELMAVEMISLSTDECKKKWSKEDQSEHPPAFNFSYPEQFCLVTRDPAEDETYLPNDGPLVCDRLYVGIVSYGPERRSSTRAVPVVAQSLAVLVEWMQFDSYFESIGCFGKEADCQKDDKLGDYIGKGSATKNVMDNFLATVFLATLALFTHSISSIAEWFQRDV